jgi:hypothetical protein
MAHREVPRRRRAAARAPRPHSTSLYGWLWRRLPGPTAVRALSALLLLAGVLALLFAVVFPAVEPLLPFDDSALE